MNTPEQIEIIRKTINDNVKKNRFVKVAFVKKTTGELREMLLGRAKRLEETVSETPSESVEKRKNTLSTSGRMCVEELTPDHKYQFRTIDLRTIRRVTANGVTTEYAG